MIAFMIDFMRAKAFSEEAESALRANARSTSGMLTEIERACSVYEMRNEDNPDQELWAFYNYYEVQSVHGNVLFTRENWTFTTENLLHYLFVDDERSFVWNEITLTPTLQSFEVYWLATCDLRDREKKWSSFPVNKPGYSSEHLWTLSTCQRIMTCYLLLGS